MKAFITSLLMLFCFIVSNVYAQSNSAITNSTVPPGLQNKDLPQGLQNQNKTPYGWSQGQKKGWQKSGKNHSNKMKKQKHINAGHGNSNKNSK